MGHVLQVQRPPQLLFCSGECASAGLQLHRCVPTYTQGRGYDMSNYDPENTNFDPMPAGAPVIISGHWLKIMGLAHDLGEGAGTESGRVVFSV